MASPARAVKIHGAIRPPGDKSITHRALILAALAHGRSRITGALTSDDAKSSARVLRALGAAITPLAPGREVLVTGKPWRRPKVTLDCGNSGTTSRLMLGALAGHAFAARLTGDASLRKRPMRRVTGPLAQMGARFTEEGGDGLPLTITGGSLKPLDYVSPTSSAQVKSAIMLAGLTGGVPVIVREPVRSRDHTERFLRGLGLQVHVEQGAVTALPGQLHPFDIVVPGDISSAAFMIGAALLADGGELTITGVGLNPTRMGALAVLSRMGAAIDVRPTSEMLGEPVGELRVRPSALTATTVAPEEVPSLIDEIPILAVLASRASGETVFRGVKELAVKESNRLKLLADNLSALGVPASATTDELCVTGSPKAPVGRVETALDHRIAMAFAVLGTVPGAKVKLSEKASVSVSYPGFFDDLKRISRG